MIGAASRPPANERRTTTDSASSAAAKSASDVQDGRRARSGSTPSVVTQKNATQAAVHAKSPADLPTGREQGYDFDLSSLRKAQYGASIMPVTVLNRLRERYPDLGFYNCFGQSEIGPLACVLGPDEHADRLTRL